MADKQEATTLHQKLLEVQKQVTGLQKNEKMRGKTAASSYEYVSSSQVLQSVRTAMDEQGLLLAVAITSSGLHLSAAYDGKQHLTELDLEMTWINADDPEDMAVYPWYGQGIDSGEKGVGKALTYAEKYFLLKFFHIATDKDDPDSVQAGGVNGAVTPPAETSRRRQVKPAAEGTWGKENADKFRAAADEIGMPEEHWASKLAVYKVSRLEDLPVSAKEPMDRWFYAQQKNRQAAEGSDDDE